MFVITQSCCSDAACVAVCPVNCIHPTPEERGFGTSDILHVDPQACIDCGACADACPVNAIYPADKLGARDKVFIDINADYYKSNPDIQSGYAPTGAELPGMAPFPDVVAARPSSYTTDDDWPGVTYPEIPKLPVGLRIALVGTGPSGGYALRTLLDRTGPTSPSSTGCPLPVAWCAPVWPRSSGYQGRAAQLRPALPRPARQHAHQRGCR